MKISITMAKNEEDIIETFVRHNLQYLDKMFIADNLSTDNTLVILNALKNDGMPIEILIDDEQAYHQGDKITKIYHTISRQYDISMVYLLDADEFIVGDICSRKNNYNPGSVLLLESYTYIVTDPDFKEPNILKRMQYRHEELNEETRHDISLISADRYKSMIVHDSDKYKDYKVSMGSHQVMLNGKKFNNGWHDSLRLAHFPIRSKEQFLSKNVLGWLALRMRNPADQFSGSHWKHALDFALKHDMKITNDMLLVFLYKTSNLLELKSKYIFDPITVNFSIKYAHLMNNKNLLTSVLETYSTSIEVFYNLRKELAANSCEPLTPPQTSFPNAIQKCILSCCKPFIRLWAPLESIIEFECDPSDYFYRIKHFGLRLIRTLLIFLGPRPEKTNFNIQTVRKFLGQQ
jgi:hypothetical protein